MGYYMSYPIIVGKLKPDPSQRKARSCYAYSDVKFNNEGWADAIKFLPKEFDLCDLKTETGKIFRGWYSGQSWDGINVKPKCNIKFWKRHEENE